MSRGIAPAAALVCSVDSTKCPGSAARTINCAVSVSHVSPTRITSGSCRSSARKPALKVSPVSSFTCVWRMSGMVYSIGSSSVKVLTFMVLICRSAV